MTEGIIVAIIGGAVTIVGGLVMWWLRQLSQEIAAQKTRIEKLEHRDKLSWLYIRRLIDHAYRHGAVPLPEPPAGWLEDE
ncbi:hypothetical protein [Microbacterium soli]|uniref:Uncharacterized protein n=1 Tax=Microbacterium soli TaxID=446075 RepID=A0ABP7NI98_9MICO